MNIDKIFPDSFKLFNTTISSIFPFIIFYSILILLLDYLFGISAASDDFLLLPKNIYYIIGALTTYLVNLLYSILIIQFIFNKIKLLNITFNLNSIITSVYRIIGLYFIIFIVPALCSLIFSTFNPLSAIFILAIPILYIISFFSQYLIIIQKKNIIESIFLSYMFIKENLIPFCSLIIINIIFVILMVYISIIIIQFSLIINAIILNIQLYFIAIFNIQFYHLVSSNEKKSGYVNE